MGLGRREDDTGVMRTLQGKGGGNTEAEDGVPGVKWTRFTSSLTESSVSVSV